MNNFKKIAVMSLSTLLLFSCTDEGKKESSSSSSSSSSLHEHTYASEWSHDESKHWHDDTCGHGTKKEEGDHTFDEGKEVYEGTKFTCSVCEYSKTEASKYRVTEKEWDEAFAFESLTVTQSYDSKVKYKAEVGSDSIRLVQYLEAGTSEQIYKKEDGAWFSYTLTPNSDTWIKEGAESSEGLISSYLTGLSLKGKRARFDYDLDEKSYSAKDLQLDGLSTVLRKVVVSFLNKEIQSYEMEATYPSYSLPVVYSVTKINSTEVETPDASKIHQHTYSDTWSSDNTYHWYADTCGHGTEKNKAEHDFQSVVTAPTYETQGYTTYTCSVCGYSYKDDYTNQLTHIYSSSWSKNETEHWHACTDEGYGDLSRDKASHTFDDVVTPATYDKGGYTTHTCTVCGYSYKDQETDQLQHNYSSEWSSNSSYHWHACTDEGYTSLKGDEAQHTYVAEVTEPTYEAGGYTTYTCSVCGYSYKCEYTSQLEHNYSSEYSYDENTHWYACTDEGYEDLKRGEYEHFMLSKVVIPTYDQGGYELHYCRICKYSYKTNEKDQLVHEYSDTWSYDSATHWHDCTDPGYYSLIGDVADHEFNKTGDCTICGYSKASQSLEISYYMGNSRVVKGIGSETSKDIIIPSENGKVVKINDKAFKNTDIRSIVIPDSVTEIGESAFQGCDSLEYVYIGSGLKTLGDDAFYGCKSLAKIEISENNKTFDHRNDCNAIINTESSELLVGTKNTIIPEDVTSIGARAFYGNTLEEISIPDSVKTISSSAFYGCESLKKVDLGSGVETISNYAFYGCKSLESIEMPDSVTSMGYHVFVDCTSLVSAKLSNNITYLPEYSFCGCSSLEEVTFGEKITSIGQSSFYKCSSLISIELENVKTIGTEAFLGCTSLESVSFSNALTGIYFGAFHYCSSLTSIDFPDSLTGIGDYAFNGCTSLESINIPKNVASVGTGAFGGCTSLSAITVDPENGTYYSENNGILCKDEYSHITLVAACKNTTISNDVTIIGERAFAGVKGLSSITLPDSLEKIENYAFSGCSSLESINIPKNVSSIGTNPFASCSSLSTITVDANNNYYTSRDLYYNNKPECNVIVYRYSSGTFDCRLVSGCKNSTIPTTVSCINEEAFYGCSGLESLDLPNGIATIFENAFSYCTSLKEVKMSTGLKVLWREAFSHCSSLESISLPSGLEDSYNNYTFSNVFASCTSLKKVELAEGICILPSSMFSNCESLTEVYLPSTITKISDSAFRNCGSVKFFYNGTSEDFEKITVNKTSTSDSFAGIDSTNLYFYSETMPTTDGNYWHYLDSEKTTRVTW